MDLVVAAETGNIERVREILENEDADVINVVPAFLKASIIGHTEIVRLLLKKGADPNMSDVNGYTILMIASRFGENTEIVRLLLDKGAHINVQDVNGKTVLMEASHFGNTDMVRLLLDKGADPNIRDRNRDTALSIAVTGGHTDIVELLERYMMRLTRTQKASQKLKASRLPVDNDVSRMIGKHLSRMPYNPEVARRIEEERENERIADYVKDLNKSGGKKKRKKTKKKKKKRKSTKTK